jgi:hypothetical protein
MLVAVTELDEAITAHRAEPFPESVDKGDDYGEVDAVMIGADICGWATAVSEGRMLGPSDLDRLTTARDELDRSLPTFPAAAQPYYRGVLAMADLAIAAQQTPGRA